MFWNRCLRSCRQRFEFCSLCSPFIALLSDLRLSHCGSRFVALAEFNRFCGGGANGLLESWLRFPVRFHPDEMKTVNQETRVKIRRQFQFVCVAYVWGKKLYVTIPCQWFSHLMTHDCASKFPEKSLVVKFVSYSCPHHKCYYKWIIPIFIIVINAPVLIQLLIYFRYTKPTQISLYEHCILLILYLSATSGLPLSCLPIKCMKTLIIQAQYILNYTLCSLTRSCRTNVNSVLMLLLCRFPSFESMPDFCHRFWKLRPPCKKRLALRNFLRTLKSSADETGPLRRKFGR